MDAAQLFGTLIRILNQPVFPRRAPKARSVQGRPFLSSLPASSLSPLGPESVSPLAVPTGHAPITLKPADRAGLPAVSPKPAAPAAAPTQAMRTLDEVRADLARLRDQAKRRQAQVQRDLAFAPTDFMEYGGALPPTPRPAAAGSPQPSRAFAPTDFLELGTGRPS